MKKWGKQIILFLWLDYFCQKYGQKKKAESTMKPCSHHMSNWCWLPLMSCSRYHWSVFHQMIDLHRCVSNRWKMNSAPLLFSSSLVRKWVLVRLTLTEPMKIMIMFQCFGFFVIDWSVGKACMFNLKKKIWAIWMAWTEMFLTKVTPF